MAPPTGHAVEASDTVCSSRTTGGGGKKRVGEKRNKKVRGVEELSGCLLETRVDMGDGQ